MAGFETVGQCEWADYQTKVLEKHWPSVPRWKDIRTLTKDSFYERTGLRTVDVLSGGFPCQPFSQAGKRGGKADDRYLWPEMLRVIREIRPTWVLGENVPGIVNLALDTVLSDLENEGYASQAFIVPACGVDAPHRRDRVAILAYSVNRGGSLRREWELQDLKEAGRERLDYRGGETTAFQGERRKDESGSSGVVDGIRTEVYRTDPNTDSDGLQGRHNQSILDAEFTDCSSKERERERESGTRLRRTPQKLSGMHSAWEDWPDEPGVDRVVDRVPNRVDRVKCLGNAVVPQQFYPFFAAIAEIERGDNDT
jgi:DNA (cytosine-5)-methyltransferase 1